MPAESKPMANVVCYGETLLRLTAPENGTLLQLPSLGVNVGGAEANVAVSLTRLGHSASLATVLPDNALGYAALGCWKTIATAKSAPLSSLGCARLRATTTRTPPFSSICSALAHAGV